MGTPNSSPSMIRVIVKMTFRRCVATKISEQSGEMIGSHPHLVLVHFAQAGPQVRVVHQVKSGLALFARGGDPAAEVGSGFWTVTVFWQHI